MLRRILTIAFLFGFAVALTGACNEPEYKTTQHKEETHESEPQDTSPGEMVVE